MPLITFDKPFALTIKSSLQKNSLIIIPHVLALVLVISIPVISMLMTYLLIVLIVNSLAYFSFRYIALSLNQSVVSIAQDSEKNWFLATADNNRIDVELLDSSFASKLMIIINYMGINNKKYTTVIMPDSVSPDEYRRLLVRLKLI